MKLSKYKALKTYLKGKKHFAGRNNQGKITIRHQGGGHKQNFRQILWDRNEKESIVVNFEYDPNRTAYLAKICQIKGFYDKASGLKEKDSFSYILAPKGLKIFDKIQTLKKKVNTSYLRPGDCSILYNFEAGDIIHAVEAFPGKGPIFARAAGTYCQLLHNFAFDYAQVKLPSGSQRLISLTAKGTLGILGRENFSNQNLKKAGRNRWLNKRPTVRGVAMNPIDHPHGGGQGKTKGGRPSVTPTSKPTKGQPTRSKRKKNILILTSRKKTK